MPRAKKSSSYQCEHKDCAGNDVSLSSVELGMHERQSHIPGRVQKDLQYIIYCPKMGCNVAAYRCDTGELQDHIKKDHSGDSLSGLMTRVSAVNSPDCINGKTLGEINDSLDEWLRENVKVCGWS